MGGVCRLFCWGKMKKLDKQNFIVLTKKEFQQYSESPITDEQAIEIQTNLFGFVNLLIEWDKNEQKSCKISNTQQKGEKQNE